MTASNSRVEIDRQGFKNACIKHTGIPFLVMTVQDMENCAEEFGMKVTLYFRRYLLCTVIDEHKLFLNRIKYGF
jgi:hypothetical protein